MIAARKLKLPVSVTGPFMVINVELLVPEYELVPNPVHPLKAKPLDADALIFTTELLLFQPLAGLTLPPGPAFIVRKYCVAKFAVYVVLVYDVTECEIDPLSFHEPQTY